MKLKWLLTVGALAAATLAGCGSSDSGSSSTSAKTSSTGGATGTPVKIGVVGPKGTTTLNEGFEIASVKAAARAVNARGGINGHPLEVVYCNDKGDPNQTATCARQMIDEKVIGVFGSGLLNGGTVLTPALEKAGIPQVGLVAISAEEYNSPNVFLFGTGGNGIYNVLAAYATQHKIPTAIAQADNPVAKPLVDGIKAVMKAGGAAPTAQVMVGATQADYAPLVQAASRNGTQAVIPFLGSEQASQFMSASESAGQKLDWLSGYIWPAADAEKFGGAATLDRTMTAQQFLPLNSDNPLIQQFVKEMKAEAYSGDADAKVNSSGLATVLPGGWLGVWALEQIAKEQNLQTIDAATFKQALKATKNLDMKGTMPPWTPDAAGAKGLARAANDKYFLIGWENGEPKLLSKTPMNVADIYAGKADDIKYFPSGS